MKQREREREQAFPLSDAQLLTIARLGWVKRGTRCSAQVLHVGLDPSAAVFQGPLAESCSQKSGPAAEP